MISIGIIAIDLASFLVDIGYIIAGFWTILTNEIDHKVFEFRALKILVGFRVIIGDLVIFRKFIF